MICTYTVDKCSCKKQYNHNISYNIAGDPGNIHRKFYWSHLSKRKHLTTFNIFCKKQKQKRGFGAKNSHPGPFYQRGAATTSNETGRARPAVPYQRRSLPWPLGPLWELQTPVLSNETALVQRSKSARFERLFGFSWFHSNYTRFICAHWLCYCFPNLHQKYPMSRLHRTKTSLVTTWKGSQNRDISRPWKTYLFEVVLLQRVPNQQEYKSHNTSNMLLQSNTTHLYMCIYNATASHPCTYLVYLILGKHTADTEHKLKEYLNLKT